MKLKAGFYLRLFCTIIILILCAALPNRASADEGTPPSPQPSENETNEAVPPDNTTLDVVAAPDDVVGLNENNNSEEIPEPSSEAGPDVPAPTDEIIIIGETGQILPLVSQEAVDALVTGDPIWCPSTVAVPKPNTYGCTNSFDSLDALFDDLEIHPKTVDGTVWIQKDYSDTSPAILDGSLIAFSSMRNFKITLKGGWNGCNTTCVGTIDTSDPSDANHKIEILDWNNDVSLSDLVITDVSTSGDSLVVETSGSINLTRVQVKENDGAGARLENVSGSKDVIVILSVFNQNQTGDGLEISSKGNITLSSVIASGNGGVGVELNNENALLPKNISLISGSYEFADNGDSGLLINSRGFVTLKDISSISNGGDGASINNAGSPTMLGVTFQGVNVFSENSGSGLIVTSSGPIVASNLVNNANGNYGAQIDNVASTKANAVSLFGSNQFKFNGTGLSVVSNGTITLNNISASNNQSVYGASLNNSASTFGSNITLTGTNDFNENQQDGLLITSAGVITLYKTTANSNGQGELSGIGASLVNTAAISAKSVVVTASTFNDNFEGGLFVSSDGAISISSLIANANGGKGAELINQTASPVLPQNVTLTGSVGVNANGDMGLEVQSLGTITLAFLTASGNQSSGATLSNATSSMPRTISISGNSQISDNQASGLLVSSKGAITLNNLSVIGNQGSGVIVNNDMLGANGGVSLSGTTNISGNSGTGLDISSRGNILITNVKAMANSGNGAVLNNGVSGLQGTVNVGTTLANWCNEFSENDGSGLEITSNGTITLNNVCASKNGNLITPGYGAIINNGAATLPKAVILNGTNAFNENYSGGLQITSTGPITISNLTATYSLHGFGASLNNTASTVNKPQLISITGTNHISANYGNGLTVISYGAITINNLTASNNGANDGSGYGAWLNNCNVIEGLGEDPDHCETATPQPITLTGRNSFSSNRGDGLQIFSLGIITLNNVSATSNTGIGATLNNDFPAASGAVTLNGALNIFDLNSAGLNITSRRTISILNLEASSNTSYGANINNFANPPAPQNVTISGFAQVNGNENGYGLSIRTLGTISISNLSSSNNAAQGAILDNAEPGAIGAINLIGGQQLNKNGDSGLDIDSNRAVNISNVTASLNNGYGLVINNTEHSLVYDVKITGSSAFSENNLTGLEIHTFGAITLNNVSARGNGIDDIADFGYGVYLDNATGNSLVKPVTLTGTNSFNDNFEDGLYIKTLGQVITYSLSAFRNTSNGVNIDNSSGIAGIQLTGINNFQNNSRLGLIILSRGAISMSGITANLNQSGGARIDNSASSYAASVLITGINSFSNNGTELIEGTGLEVKSRGAITLTTITANGNSYFGTLLDNKTLAIGTPLTTISGVNDFSANANSGLYLQGGGKVTISKLRADGNVGDGVVIATIQDVFLTCASITGNDGIGLSIFIVNGKATLIGVFAFGNSTTYGNTNLPVGTVIMRACPLP